MTPTKALSRLLHRLRNRYLVRRALEILAIALALDLLTNATSLGMFLTFGISVPTQFFLQALLTILIAQAAWRSREKTFADFLDRTFGLKDRIYSHLQYRKDPSVPEMLREAQAMECLRSLDATALALRLGPRFPRSLILTIPLFTGLTFYYMNIPYIPPSPIGRTVVSMLAPQPPAASMSASDSDAAPRKPSSEAAAAASTDQEVAKASEAASRHSAPVVPSGAAGNVSDGKGVAGPDRRGVSDEEPAGSPGTIKSFPVTAEVSPVTPPVLADESSMPDLYDPRRLLGLVPWPKGNQEELNLRQMARDVPTPSLEGYPVAYRGHIDRYFKELLAW